MNFRQRPIPKVLTRFLLLVAGGFAVYGLVPESVWAVELIPECAESGICSLCDFVGVFINWAELIVTYAGLLSVLFFIIGGLFWILSAGNPERVKRGQKILAGVLIGDLIIVGGWLIVNFAIAGLLNADFNNVTLFPGEEGEGGIEWYELACAPQYAACTSASDKGKVCSQPDCSDNCVCDSSGADCSSECQYRYSTGSCSTDCAETATTIGGELCPPTSTGATQYCCVPQ